MIKPFLNIVIILVFTFNSFSQNHTLKGFVKDSLQNPLPFANVIAEPIVKSNNLKFGITDEKGRYKIELKKGEYLISVSYLGFKKQILNLLIKRDTIKNFTLKEKENTLDEIIIKIPIIVKQDTIIYNTDKFVNGKERKLKNVLKKLPGVEVDKNGNVIVQGKKVTKLLIEGKPFFGGGTKLGVNNIPADVIEKIAILDNYNEVGFLKNLSDSEEMAMNITLKEDKKKFIFGDIGAGKGNQDFYRTHSNLFYYSPKTTLNFIGNLNNTGEKKFTFKDFLNFQGGISAVFKNGFSSLLKSNGDLSQFLESQDFLKSNNKFGALNIVKSTSETLDISGFGIFSYSKINTLENNINQYATYIENTDINGSTKNVFGIGKLNIDYTPNSKEQWYFKTQLKQTNNSFKKTNNISIENNNNSIITDKNDNQLLLNQNIEWHKKASKKHTFSTSTNFSFDKNKPTFIWNSTQSILQGLIPLETDNNYVLKQIKRNQSTNLEAIFKHYWILNNSNHIYTTLGNAFSKQQYSTNDSQLLSNGTINDFGSSQFNNDLDFKFNDLFLGLHYKFRAGKLTFKQGFFIRNYSWYLKQSSNLENKKTLFLPDFNIKLQFSKSEKLKLKYNLKSSFGNASQFANKFQLQSYNSVYKGNPLLENELYHSANLSYNKFSMYKGIMLLGNLNYVKKKKGIQNNIEFQETNQFITSVLVNNPETQWNFNSSIRKRIKKINYTLKSKISNSKYLQKIDNKYNTNIKNNLTLGLSAKTLYKKFPTIEIGYDKSIGNYTSNNNTSKFNTDKSFLNIDYDFKDFVFTFEYEYYNYLNKQFNLENKYQLANTSLLYQKENSAWSFEVNAQNLFNSKFRNQNSFSDYIITDNKKFIQPFSLLFSLNYKL
ncbi:carboxypeptidase-like regulatory domain-containing protein [Tenacibaculum finnmarkense]|uniref:carboxypeptidase-like regulatory domain-containing protein n=1 Tax=Tenacibaculum finnmarkense TaxID=2781243 RepID=UPI0018E92D9C|nr:carboxypeptidase-like regulatory domain-containing protein [Tenacibaculum finnmarkense]WCC41503.1 carboxypeptidase-like regulatory domain-containing protein [Tenacibaculum finnmarkense]